jgi:ribosomal protein L30E|tara:strand:+ start:753 stop:1004 length:252 start_codon:yes stop_codon:yes gene_type:complete
MSIKEIKEAIDEGKMMFGVKQAVKHSKGKGKDNVSRVFVAKDARDVTIDKLEEAKVEFEVLKTKEEIAKELGTDFESEVFSIK